MSDEMMVRKVLLRAAELVEQGWCQSAAGIKGGRVISAIGDVAYLATADQWCLSGAIAVGAYELLGEYQFGELMHVAQNCVNREIGGIAPWNDRRGRTQSEVVAVLRSIAQAQP